MWQMELLERQAALELTLFPGIKFLCATLPAEIFYWGFLFLKSSPRDIFVSRSALKGQ
jgi:hypothetical protein